MFIQLMDSPLFIDGKPIAKDMQIYVPRRITPQDKISLQAKFVWINCEEEMPLNILINEANFGLEKLNIVIHVIAKELNYGIDLNIKAYYTLSSMKWKVAGNVNNKPLNENVSNIWGIIPIIINKI